MPSHIGIFMCQTLDLMSYTIKMGDGTEVEYSAKDYHMFGTDQGAGWSPPCWAANSDVISHVMERYTPGMLLEHPNGTLTSHRHIIAFVDDSSIGVTASALDDFNPAPNDPVPKGANLYEQAQYNTQFYSRFLYMTGGILTIHKCVAYLLLFAWIKSIKKLEKVKHKYPPIKMQQGINEDYDFVRIEDPGEAVRMLGGYVALDGNTEK